MNQDEYNSELSKHIAQIREIEAQGRRQGNTTMHYTTGDIKKWIDNGTLPKHLGEWYLKWIDDQNRKSAEWQKFIADNPGMPPEEMAQRFFGYPKTLSPEESLEHYKETVNLGTIHSIISTTSKPDKQASRLYRNVNPENYVGITQCLANALNYLLDLLPKNTQDACEKIHNKNYLPNNTKHLYDKHYKIEAEIKDSYNRKIKLVHEFQADSSESAIEYTQKYKDLLTTTGLKTLFAYWAEANRRGSYIYSTALSDIMSLMASSDRVYRFTADERANCWRITKLLMNTKIQLERPKGTRVVEWVDIPLITINSGERESDQEDYPLNVDVIVFGGRPNQHLIEKKELAPTIYSNSTLQLDPRDMFGAMWVQTRAGQKRGKDQETSHHLDWDLLFKIGGLEGTAKKNKRGARAKAREKLRRLQNVGIVSKSEETETGMRINI
jgi:hypothetical protein